MTTIIALLNEFSPLATAIGVLLAARAIGQRRSLAQSSFEDGLVKEYRELIRAIPVDVLLGKHFREIASRDKRESVRETIFNYLDLCNEQIYLRKKRRIRRSTWQEWAVGISLNLKLPMFLEVWEEVKSTEARMFADLQIAESEGFKSDPGFWRIRRVKALNSVSIRTPATPAQVNPDV